MGKPDLGDYKGVDERIADFREKYPEGSLQPLNHETPFEVVSLGQQTFVVYVAAAYRTPDDPRPGVGIAWEPVPGKTPFTRDSEIQNAETSAWGRAIIAVGASDARGGIATRQDVQNRDESEYQPPPTGPTPDEDAQMAGWEDDAERQRVHDALKPGLKKLVDEGLLSQEIAAGLWAGLPKPLPMTKQQFDTWIAGVERAKLEHAEDAAAAEKLKQEFGAEEEPAQATA